MSTSICPCGSQKDYNSCCQPLLSGLMSAPTPEALMRSRYTAFTKVDNKYLMASWHPETRPDTLDSEPSNWIGLEIVATGEDGDFGQVEFIAQLTYEGKLETLHELSNFEKIDGKWLYVDGEFKEKCGVEKISKKAPCPCGSGELFKHCHGSK